MFTDADAVERVSKVFSRYVYVCIYVLALRGIPI